MKKGDELIRGNCTRPPLYLPLKWGEAFVESIEIL